MTTRLRPGPCWRVAPVGTTEVYLNHYQQDGSAVVSSQGVNGRWAKQPIIVDGDDLFADRASARAEYRARKAQDARHLEMRS